MRRFRSLAACVLSAVLAGTAAAQQRPLSGTVTDSAAGSGLAGALVSVRGMRLSATTLDNGSFVIPNAPAGALTLQVRAIGYRRQDVAVSAGQNTVRVALVRDVFRIEEIVITGQATGIERRNLANAVGRVNAEDLGAVPTASIEHQLAGKVAGADIQMNSGAPGGGVQVRLRGITSVNADAQPLYVVDGAIVSDVAIPSNQNEVTNAAGGSNPSLNQDAQVNRIADLNPEDIESIEILKGASAAAIYGGRASNGVVIITTRRGRMGVPRVTLTQRFGASRVSNSLGSRRFETAAEVDAAFGLGTAAANNYTPGLFFDHEDQLAGRTGMGTETSGSISGGTDATRYFLSGIVHNEDGVIENTGFQRQSVRLNLDQRVGSRISVGLATNVIHSVASRGLTNNDNATTSFYMTLPFTPSFVNLAQRPDGTFPNNTIAGSNPLQTAALMRNDEKVWRFISSGRLDWSIRESATSSWRLLSVGGLDFFNQDNDLFFPPELQFEPQDGQPGTALLSESNSQNLNLDNSLVWRLTPAHARWALTTSAGVQYARRSLNVARVTGRNLIAGQQNIDAATNIRVRQDRQLVKNLGFFAQGELLTMGERLLLTAGMRADRSSLNSDPDQLFYYPKAAVSHRLIRPFGFANEIKLRAAYGESGNEPLYGQRFSPMNATLNIGGLPGTVVGGTTASPDLHPERQREFELGFDAQLFRDRGSLEFSVYQKNISELLLTRTLAPSSGFLQEIFNGGKMRTRGVELSLQVVPLRRGTLQWFSRTTFSTTRSTITELPVPSFLAGGFGVSLGAFRIAEGQSATQIVGNDTTAAGAVIERKVGDATPNFRMSFTHDLTWGGWSLHAQADWQSGGSLINLTKLLYDFGQVTEDYDAPIAGATQTVGERRLGGWLAGVTSNYIESASFLKVREVSLSYDLPGDWVRRLWGSVRTARVSLSARNLFTISPYTGLDPEVSNFGNQPIARNIDVAPFPPSRSFWFSVQLGL